MNLAFGIDIGGTNTKIGLVDESGKLLDFTTFPTTEPKSFELFAARVKESADNLLKKNNIPSDQVLGIGVGAPNGNSRTGHIENPPNLKHWGTVDLVTPFKKVFNQEVLLENDANVAALGEALWGAAKGSKDFLVVTLGTGIGTGIIVNGSLLRGANGLAGEGGHIIIEDNGRQCGCGGFGHLEMYGSVKGIKLTTKQVTGQDLSFHEISARYHDGDPQIREVFDITAKYLGKGLAAMGSILAPEYIVLAGGVATIGADFAKKVEATYNDLVYAPFKGLTKVLISQISTAEGAVLGAASLIFHDN